MTPFAIIPVLDLKQGRVVHARAGDRANYRPLVSPLAASAQPLDVLRGLLAVAPFAAIYIADLDAITGTGDHRAEIAQLRRAAPGLAIWVDGGFAGSEDAAWTRDTDVVPVLGSESLGGADALAEAGRSFGKGGFVLSLDYRRDQLLGAPAIAADPALWPDRIILMTLDRIGMDRGPDLAGLERLVGRAGPRQVFAAGGVRGPTDVEALAAIGVAGALVASALHDGRLPAASLTR